MTSHILVFWRKRLYLLRVETEKINTDKSYYTTSFRQLPITRFFFLRILALKVFSLLALWKTVLNHHLHIIACE